MSSCSDSMLEKILIQVVKENKFEPPFNQDITKKIIEKMKEYGCEWLENTNLTGQGLATYFRNIVESYSEDTPSYICETTPIFNSLAEIFRGITFHDLGKLSWDEFLDLAPDEDSNKMRIFYNRYLENKTNLEIITSRELTSSKYFDAFRKSTRISFSVFVENEILKNDPVHMIDISRNDLNDSDLTDVLKLVKARNPIILDLTGNCFNCYQDEINTEILQEIIKNVQKWIVVVELVSLHNKLIMNENDAKKLIWLTDYQIENDNYLNLFVKTSNLKEIIKKTHYEYYQARNKLIY